MSKEKKTALDLMAEELVPRIKCGGQGVCPITEELCCDTEEKPCIENVKQYFQEQAAIPDGWQTVKDIMNKYFSCASMETFDRYIRCLRGDIFLNYGIEVEKATIPEGWDFVKEIQKLLDKSNDLGEFYLQFNKLITEAGIEVE